jgi:broad specificity phosphatase PhoE
VTITLLRHGRTEYDVVDRFIGHGRDLAPLTSAGIADAERAATSLAATPVDLVVSSPMTRALQTAMIVGRRLDREVVVELDLHEWMPDSAQRWHGPTVPTEAYDALRSAGGEWPSGTTPGWEPLSAVRARAWAAIGRHDDRGDLLVVCHSVVIEALTGVAGCGHGETVVLA